MTKHTMTIVDPAATCDDGTLPNHATFTGHYATDVLDPQPRWSQPSTSPSTVPSPPTLHATDAHISVKLTAHGDRTDTCIHCGASNWWCPTAVSRLAAGIAIPFTPAMFAVKHEACVPVVMTTWRTVEPVVLADGRLACIPCRLYNTYQSYPTEEQSAPFRRRHTHRIAMSITPTAVAGPINKGDDTIVSFHKVKK